MFGKEGRGFERFNLALPRSAVESAMARLLKAWQDLQADWAANGRPERLTLEAGMKMPDFTYDTPFASGLRFVEECGGRPAVLLFHRYYGCSVCNAAMDRLAADYDAVTAAGGQVKVVVQSAPERVREAMGGENRFPFDVVCDPERTLYERFSVFPVHPGFQGQPLRTAVGGPIRLEVLPRLQQAGHGALHGAAGQGRGCSCPISSSRTRRSGAGCP